MLRYLLISFIFTLFAAPEVTVLAASQDQSTQAKLRSRIPAYSLQAEDLAHALISFAGRFQLPMGIEWVRSPETTRKISLSWKNASVQHMLEVLVSGQGGYRLAVSDDGVVHVFPISAHSNAQDFLNLTIERFELHNEVLEVASHRLRDLIRAKLSGPSSQSQTPAGMGFSQGAQVGDPEFSLELRQVPVREVLDRLALASDRKIWVVTFASGKGVTSTGDRRTITLWNNSNIPDTEQPLWDTLRWTDTIP
jgi:hypothetical protein